MNAKNWLGGVVVTVGLSLGGGAALAAGPAPHGSDVAWSDGDRGGKGHDGRGDFGGYGGYGVGDAERPARGDRGGYDDRLDDRGGGRFDEHDQRFDRAAFRLFLRGKAKIADGRELQEQGARLLRRAQFERSWSLKMKAQRLITRGERLERQGWVIVRRARG